jgi:nicotinamidase-related amidase
VKLKPALVLLSLLVLLVAACERATSGARVPVYDRPQIALVLVGVEKDALDEAMIAAANALAAGAKPLGVEVAYVHRTGSEIDPRIERASEHVFTTDRADSFASDDFDAFLRSRGVDHLVLAGAGADRAIYFTSQGAKNRGYKVQIVGDAVTSPTERRRRRAIESLRASGAEIATREQVTAEWTRRMRYLSSR